MTHEEFVSKVRTLAVDWGCARTVTPEECRRLLRAKLVYGKGEGHYRGVCYYGTWGHGPAVLDWQTMDAYPAMLEPWEETEETADFIEIAATGEESATQLAGTTIHETAHVLAGPGAGHGPVWKAACARLGLTTAQAAGQRYIASDFAPDLGAKIDALPTPQDGTPRFGIRMAGVLVGLPKIAPCPMGIGTRGGKSRGVGSGSRLRLWECGCAKPVKVRVASDDFQATCKVCEQDFQYAGK